MFTYVNQMCYQHIAVVPDTCSKPREAGPCHTYKLQWYHDAHQEKCTQFVYSGCGGNDNNFKTEAECERRCGQVQPTTTDATTAAVTTVVEVVQGQSMSVLSSRVEMGKGKVSPMGSMPSELMFIQMYFSPVQTFF